MLMLLRQIAAILALPAMVTIAIPIAIARPTGLGAWRPASPLDVAMVIGGAVVGIAGVALFASSVALFWTRGRGTLAPWDPPRQFVAAGPYRIVRNPMITGVVLVLVGEALAFRSAPLGWWAALFAVINATYIPLVEEPQLRLRFGQPYDEYCRHVPRILPRLRPWTPDQADGGRS